MHDTDDIGSNDSGNPHIWDMIEARIERRSFLGGTLAVAAGGFLGGTALASTQRCATSGPAVPPPRSASARVRPAPTTPSSCRRATRTEMLAPWGTPLLAGAPAFRRGRLEHRGRPGAAGRLQPRRHALLPAAEVRQLRAACSC